MAKMSLDDLRKLRESKKGDLSRRNAEGKEMQVIVGMGTCGIVAGGKETLDAFLSEVEKNGLADKVVVRQTGCMGLCHSEPTVEVLVPGMPDIIYGNVNGKVAGEIVSRHLLGRELLDGHILDRPSNDILKA